MMLTRSISAPARSIVAGKRCIRSESCGLTGRVDSRIEKSVVDRCLVVADGDSGARRECPLRIEVDLKHSSAPPKKPDADIEGRRRLADPAFLVDDRGYRKRAGRRQRRQRIERGGVWSLESRLLRCARFGSSPFRPFLRRVFALGRAVHRAFRACLGVRVDSMIRPVFLLIGAVRRGDWFWEPPTAFDELDRGSFRSLGTRARPSRRRSFPSGTISRPVLRCNPSLVAS